jgi:hypothetical protein
LLGLGARELLKCRLEKGLAHSLRLLYLGMVISMCIFTLTINFFVAITGMLAFTTFRGITFPLTDVWLNQHIESGLRAKVLSMTIQVDASSQMLGVPIIGAIGMLRSIRAVIFSASLVLLPTIPIYGRIIKSSVVKTYPKSG